MKKLNYNHFHLILVIIFYGLMTINAVGQTEQLTRSKNNILKEIERINSEISVVDKDKTSRIKQIDLLNKKIESRQKLISIYRKENKEIGNKINELSGSIIKIEKDVELIKETYSTLLRNFQIQQSNSNNWLYILDSKNFQQAYKRYQYLKQYSDYRTDQVEKLKEKSELLVAKKNVLAQEKSKKDKIEKQTLHQHKNLTEDKSRVKAIVQNLDSKKQKLLAKIENKKKQARLIEQKIREAIEKERELARRRALAEAAKKNKGKPVDKSSIKVTPFGETPQGKLVSKKFAGNKGKLSWPVNKGIIKHKFGPYHPKGLPNITFDVKGLEIETPLNAEVKAVFDGKVSAVFIVPNGTKGVVLRHGSYVTIYANLKEVYVKEGDLVKVNKNLGKVGSEDLKFGLLDFQIWIEYQTSEQNLNPEDWLIK